mgnify:CR=1 FL=1
MRSRFHDAERGGFYLAPDDADDLIVRAKESYDGALPSGNSIVSDWARGQVGLGEMLAGLSLADWTDPAIRWGEISFNEWEVPLWPMKWVMVMGGLLLVLQGISKLGKDIQAIRQGA